MKTVLLFLSLISVDMAAGETIADIFGALAQDPKAIAIQVRITGASLRCIILLRILGFWLLGLI